MPAAPKPFFRTAAGGMTVALRVSPKSSRAAVEGPMPTADGWALKVAVTAPPDKGKANAQVIALLAETFGIAKNKVAVTIGETDRRKVVHLTGDPAALAAIAQQWMPS